MEDRIWSMRATLSLRERNMPAVNNKQAHLAQLQTVLKKKVPNPLPPEADRPVLDEVLYAILREGATTEQANIAFAKLREEFFDLNEVRVSSVPEVGDAIHGLRDGGVKSQRIVELLQEIFEQLYSFDLGDIAKKGVKQAAKQLARYKSGVTDFTVAWVTQRSLGGHAIPLDHPTIRVLQRLGILDADVDELESIRGSLEHYIPKANGPDFTDRMAVFADTICTEDRPHCDTCALKADCPFGQEVLAKAKAKEAKAKKPK
jgi:endonuclease III